MWRRQNNSKRDTSLNIGMHAPPILILYLITQQQKSFGTCILHELLLNFHRFSH